MARISTYGIDAVPQLGDKVIGTDSAAGAGLATKNYSIADIVALLNETNSIAVADQVIFLFQDDISEGRESGTISFDAGGGDGTSFADITSIVVSKQAAGSKNISNYLPLFLNKDIILANSTDLNKFGLYKVTSITTHATESSFWDVGLSLFQSNGSLGRDSYYIFSEFEYPDSGDSDKTYVHTQATPSATWSIQHNLNKFPSVTSVNNSNIKMFGEVTYVDENNLTINFSAGFSGKAYMN